MLESMPYIQLQTYTYNCKHIYKVHAYIPTYIHTYIHTYMLFRMIILTRCISQLLTTDYGSSRPQSIVPAHSYTGGCIRLVALITHMGGHRHKLPPTVTGHIDNTIGYDNGGHSILVLLTLRVIVI